MNITQLFKCFAEGNIEVKASLSRRKSATMTSFECTRDGDDIVLHATGDGAGAFKYFDLRLHREGSCAVLSVDAETPTTLSSYLSFAPEDAVVLRLRLPEPERIRGYFHEYFCWTHTYCTEAISKIPATTDTFFMRYPDAHAHVYCLCGDNFKCNADGDTLCLSPCTSGIRHLKGAFVTVGVADTPYEACRENFAFARRTGALRVPLVSERKMPEFLEGLGWCTWDAFEHDVTEEKICEKLTELRDKGVPLRWVLIDDGWSTLAEEDEYITSFYSDKKKFPLGLGHCIERIKNEFGIKYVGVWHAFGAYWKGVKEGSELYLEQKENLVRTPTDFIVPSFDPERAFAFWDAWYAYLKKCGVDFVKVDNQTGHSLIAEGSMATAEALRRAHAALERAAEKYFGSAVINCMGMGTETVQSRTHSIISRTSEDYCRDDEGYLDQLTMQDIYIPAWHGELYRSDFDMWWTDLASSPRVGALHALNGAPNYISDRVGHTDPAPILPSIEKDGTVRMPDFAVRPTFDCLYDCTPCLKAWNRWGDAFGVFAVNCSSIEMSDELTLCSIEGATSERGYVAYMYFEKRFERITDAHALPFTLGAEAAESISLYPVCEDENGEYIMLGSTERYFGAGAAKLEKTYISTLPLKA